MRLFEGADPFILDALLNEAETVAGVLEYLNREDENGFAWSREWGRLFTREDVIAGLSRLILDDSVRVLVAPAQGSEGVELAARELPPTGYDDVVFEVTPRGGVRAANWDP